MNTLNDTETMYHNGKEGSPNAPFPKMTVIERLNYYVKYLGISARKFCKDSKISTGTLSRGEDVRTETLMLISNANPQLNMDWVLNGVGNMLKGHIFDSRINKSGMELLKGVILPVFDIWGQKGKKTIYNAMQNNMILTHISVPDTEDCIGWITMKGDYMHPHIKEFEIMSLKPLEPIIATQIDFGSVYYIEFDDDRDPVVRYLRKGENSQWVLKCHNEKYDDFSISPSTVSKLFKVEKAYRTL